MRKHCSSFAITVFLVLILQASAAAQTRLESLHPRPRQAYSRFFSAVFYPSAGQVIFVDPVNPAFDQAERINAHLRQHMSDTMLVRIWTAGDTLETGIYLGVRAEFINSMLAALPDQFVRVTATYPGPEGYVLDALPMRIVVNGSDEAGLRYGVHTLKQMLFPHAGWWGLEACRIIDVPEFPIRWMYQATNILVGANVTAAKQLWDRAVEHRINGIHLNDSKFQRPTTLPRRYQDSLASLRDYAEAHGLDIIPGVMPFGYSNDLLFHNPNLASGLPVREQRFVFEADTARLLPAVRVTLPNGGFEQYSNNTFPGFRFIDQPGLISFVDTQTKHSGAASIRLENFAQHSPQHGHGRISYWTNVKPFTLYHVRGWVRTEALEPASAINIAVLSNAGYNLAFNEFSIPSSTDWIPVDFTFNSLEADTVGVYWGTWGARSGRIWWDDLLLEEAAFVNLIRRDGAPLVISRSTEGPTLTEGVDFDTLRDHRMGNRSYPGDYDRWHTPPTLRATAGGIIRNGDTMLVSYYHTVLIHQSQVIATMSDPEVYDILDREFAQLDSVLEAGRYFMQHDEIRVMNWDAGDDARGLIPSGIVADNVQRCTSIIKKHAPDADIWVWSDMFDEFHNAVQGPYYLVRGDLRGSADQIPSDVGIVNWNGRENVVRQSLAFFADRGFRQISAPFYDRDAKQIRTWKEWMRGVPNVLGMMYTTWARNYDYLDAFGEYAWNHAPYVYHFPPYSLRSGEDNFFHLRIEGDTRDTEWKLEHVFINHRTQPNHRFTAHEATLTPGVDEMIAVSVPADARWLQWYITAVDNRGSMTRIPLGDTMYFELGDIATGLRHVDVAPHSLHISISPNPVRGGSRLSVHWAAPAGSAPKVILRDALGRKCLSHAPERSTGRLMTTTIGIPTLSPGFYILELHAAGGRAAVHCIIR
ncbi:MAG: hypothetical protein M5R41_14620 [Bacteroidia bacterium]|nr:hypothetical protein [Bacteroidia bacterium]